MAKAVLENELQLLNNLTRKFNYFSTKLENQKLIVEQRRLQFNHPLTKVVDPILQLPLIQICLSYVKEVLCDECQELYLSTCSSCPFKNTPEYKLENDMKLLCTHRDADYNRRRDFYLPSDEHDKQVLQEWKNWQGYERRRQLFENLILSDCPNEMYHSQCFMLVTQNPDDIKKGRFVRYHGNNNGIIMCAT